MGNHHKLLFLLFISYVTAGTLYSLINPTQLATIDPKTATITKVGTAILDEIYSQQLSAIDSRNSLYYFIGLNQTSFSSQLITLSLPDGHYISSVDLPLVQYDLGIGQTIAVDPNSGVLYITGIDPNANLHDIFRYDPKNGQFTKLNDIGYFSTMNSLNAFDARNNLLWLSYIIDNDYSIPLFALNVSSGQWKYLNVSVPMNIETMTYDSQTGLMYGIGFVEDATSLLYTFNTVSLEWKEVGPISGYLNIDLGLAAIDVINRKLFAILEVNEVNGPWQLITLDLNTATVSDHPVVYFDPDGNGFPVSLDFYDD